MSYLDLEAGRPLNSRQQDPTQDIASGIFQINTLVSTFQRLVNALGTPKDTPELREKLHKTRLHIGQLVKDTSNKLKKVSETDRIHAKVMFWSLFRPAKKNKAAKLAKDFQAVLKEFQKAQRVADERETAYTPFLSQSVLPSSSTASEIDIYSNKSSEHHALLVDSRRHEDLLLDNEITFNKGVIKEQEQGIREFHNQISEVNEILKDLAILVHEQGPTIDEIGYNIEKSHAATAEAKSHFLKASKARRSNSSMTCLLLAILGIVLCIVIIIVAV